ncbi:hypothetical protein [Tenacibaculum agarivorans]|uniref:hypothetical protein n=1 Tax=Tenacibaculum agarivorans TaxID=1908389 RepID=UPI00094B7D71|nr:hypothetical protein [Tenacibaculum agarivorans]
MELETNRFEYLPTYKKGEHLYDGIPIASISAFEILKDDGIKEIDTLMKEMLAWRKQMFGTLAPDHYGFHFMQLIADTKTKVIWRLRSLDDKDLTALIGEEPSSNKTAYQITEELIEEHKETTGNYLIVPSNHVEEGLGERAFNNRVEKLKVQTNRVCPPLFDLEKINEVKDFIERHSVFKNKNT